jgi:hypothetical protein
MKAIRERDMDDRKKHVIFLHWHPRPTGHLFTSAVRKTRFSTGALRLDNL